MIFQFPPKRRKKNRRLVTATTTLHKLTDGSVVNAGYPNGGIQLEHFFLLKKLFCHGYLNLAFCRNQLSEGKITKSTKDHLNLDLKQH